MARRSTDHDTRSDRQAAQIVEEYPNGGNGAAAYRAAYGSRSSPQVQAVTGDELLKNGKIAVIIAAAEQRQNAATARVLDRYNLDAQRIAERLARLAVYRRTFSPSRADHL